MTVELEITRLGAQGDGAADTPDGMVYVPGALPGERVRADVAGSRGRLVEVLRASAERVPAICPHFGSCGGCAAQHMSETLYRDWKRAMVAEAFGHRGLEPEIEDVVMVGAHSRRRAVLTARIAGGGTTEIGYSAEGSHELVAIERCPVLVAQIERALPVLARIAGVVAAAKAVRLKVLAADNGLDVAISGAGQVLDAVRLAEVAKLAAHAGIRRVHVDDDPVVLGAAAILDAGGTQIAIPPGGFVQASAAAEAAMRDLAVAATGKAKRIADLFCGAGAFTFALARTAHVTAADNDKALLDELSSAAKRASGLKPIKVLQRDLLREPLSRKELDAFDAVVLDPPRAGAAAQAEAIAKSGVPVVVAISCNPATMARDVRIMVDGGYWIERVVPIDQFVYAAHVEAVAILRKGKR